MRLLVTERRINKGELTRANGSALVFIGRVDAGSQLQTLLALPQCKATLAGKSAEVFGFNHIQAQAMQRGQQVDHTLIINRLPLLAAKATAPVISAESFRKTLWPHFYAAVGDKFQLQLCGLCPLEQRREFRRIERRLMHKYINTHQHFRQRRLALIQRRLLRWLLSQRRVLVLHLTKLLRQLA